MNVTRTSHRLLPDPKRVIAKAFIPGGGATVNGLSGVKAILDRILAIPEQDVSALLESVLRDFSPRHRNFKGLLENHFRLVAHELDGEDSLSRERRLLIGAYFTHEYSIEAAALCNPSVVMAPDQSGLATGTLRFIMSLRAIGEGHISSIEFRSGVIESTGRITLDSTSAFAFTGQRMPNPSYRKELFQAKLRDVGVDNEVSQWVLARLADLFSMDELMEAISSTKAHDITAPLRRDTIDVLHWLASSNYDVVLPPDSSISERVLFPDSPNESRGMEDARFVRFVEEDGSVSYFATYTAYDGHGILPQLIETPDFLHFQVRTLNGACVQNKGMAMFPRRIGGKFAMLSRQNGQSLHYMTSEDVRFWNDAEEFRVPCHPWELVQIGNCGSPMETEAGWLVLTHGVGPLRRYAIGAMLLDLDDPRRVIGQLVQPLLVPAPDEREGYVPNVVYTCGGLVHNRQLIIPYGFSDVGVDIVTLPLDDLVSRLRSQ